MRAIPGFLLVVMVACGGSSDGGGGEGVAGGTPDGGPAASPDDAYTITIQGHAFSPLRLEVPPGATVTVRNLDAMVHSVTSERAAGVFSPGASGGVSFDTGLFTGERAFTLPADAPVGVIVPYYCASHLQAMVTPTGEVAIVATPANPGAPTPPLEPDGPGPYLSE